MDDLTATRLCAEAMGRELTSGEIDGMPEAWISDTTDTEAYNPLHDDAQAMALVKRFGLMLTKDVVPSEWRVDADTYIGIRDSDLNHCIVYCVAALQEAKNG